MRKEWYTLNVILIIILLFSIFVSNVSASASADNFGVEDAIGYKNTYVLVPVNITNIHNESIVSIEFKIHYNSDIINLAEMQKGSLASAWGDPFKAGSEGSYTIGIVGILSVAITNGSSGSMVILNFSVVGVSGETSKMNITGIKLVNTSFDESGTASAKNGTFTIPLVGSALNSWTGTIKWDIPSDTSFTVSLAGGADTIDFNASGQNDTMIEPIGQNSEESTPIAVILNTGNQNLNFSVIIPQGRPNWVTMLNMSNSNTYLSSHAINKTSVNIETSVSAGNNANMYLWSNVTLAPQGIVEKTIYINSSA